MKRLIAGITLLILTAGGVYGYMLARRERSYRILVSQGDAALAGDNPSAAVEAFSGAIAIKPDAMLGYLRRGEAYRRRGELESAMRDLTHAVELDPTATPPLEQLGDVNLALKHYGNAADRYRSYLRIDDRAPRVLYKLAYATYTDGHPGAAIDSLQKALAQNDQLAEAYYLLGLCDRALGRHNDARAALERAIALQPALYDARQELADLYGAQGRTEKQLDQLEALAALDPSPARSVALGAAYARAGQIDRAVLTLGRAAERYPNQPAVYVALGRIWLEVAETRDDRVALSKAMGALQSAVERNGSDALTLFGRAQLFAHDPDSAERTLQDATTRRPVDPAAFAYLADAAEQLGHLTIARRALLDFAALHEEDDPHHRAAADARLGDLSARMNDFPAAAAYYVSASDAAGGDATYLARAADAQWRSGNHDAARQTLDRAIARDGTNQDALALKRRIKD
jgi:tetratricopeptide (TPR) repeat protein